MTNPQEFKMHLAAAITLLVARRYILPIGGLYATYHLLGEPETTIEYTLPESNIAPENRVS